MKIAARFVLRNGASCLLILCAAHSAIAQNRLNENCTVSVLNRSVRVNPDGSWVLPNVPANFGQVKARATCVQNGMTVFGESDYFTVPPNQAVNLPDIVLGAVTPIPVSLAITPRPLSLTAAGDTVQLTVTATYPDGSTENVAASDTGTNYTTSNPAIATVSADGLVTAVGSGTAVLQATNDGAAGIVAAMVVLSSIDSDGDGISDDVEVELGLDPLNPIDAQEDFDRDNLTNLREFQLGTDLRNPDSDGDSLPDGEEVNVHQTNPLLADTDGDRIPDGVEVQTGSDPLDQNSYDLRNATASSVVQPPSFVMTTSVLFPDVSQLLNWKVSLIDGKTTLDLTTDPRTNYSSSDLSVCSFGAQKGLVFAGSPGDCVVTISHNTLSVTIPGSVQFFTPTALSSLFVPGYANNVDVEGGFAFVAAGSTGLQVVDVSNPELPSIVGSLNTPGNANDVKVSGNLAFIADGPRGLRILDVSKPRNPVLVGSVDTPGDARDVAVNGELAVVADGAPGVQIIDVSVPAAPSISSTLDTDGDARAVAFSGNLVIVGDGLPSSAVRVVDVSDPLSPRMLGSVAIPDETKDLAVRDAFAYVAAFTGGFQVVDFTVASNPQIVGSIPGDFPSGFVPRDVALSGDVAIAAEQLFPHAMAIVDIGDPASPIFRDTLDFSPLGDYAGTGIDITERFVYETAESFIVTTEKNGVNGETRLFIGLYRSVQDDLGTAPTVEITYPSNGAVVHEGDSLAVQVAATDDVRVAFVTFFVNEQEVFVAATRPYEYTLIVPSGVPQLTLQATATDFGGNVGTAAEVALTVNPPLGPGHITGTVTNASNGAGLADVVVQIFDSFGFLVTQTVTGSAGVYSTQELQQGTYYVIAKGRAGFVDGLYANFTCVGCLPTSGTPILVSDGATTANIDFQLLAFGHITGRVTDIATGAAVNNATVGLYNANSEFVLGSLVDGDGNYRIDGLVPGIYYLRTFNQLGYVNQNYRGPSPAECCGVTTGAPVRVAPGGTASNVDFALMLGGRIGGRVTDAATAAGVGNVFLSVFDLGGIHVMGGVTDSLGNYVTDGGLSPGNYFVRTYNASGYFDQLHQGRECYTCMPFTGTPVAVTIGSTTNIDFALRPGGGVVRGRLTDALTGDALTNGGVSVYDETGAFVASGFVIGTGDYIVTAGLSKGTYFASTFNGQGYLNQVYDGLSCNPCSVASGTPIHMDAGTSVTIDFALLPGGRIGGTVTEAGGGEPLVNVAVDIYDGSGAWVTNGWTDGSGSYTTGALPDGTYFAKTFNTLGYLNQLYRGQLCVNCTVTTGALIEVSVGMVTTGIDFALSPGAQIRGHIEDAATRLPVSNGGVNVYDSAGRYVTSGWTNGAGDYVIDGALVPGTYYAATFNSQGYVNQLHGGSVCLSCDVRTGTPIRILGTANVTIHFSLTLGGRIDGRITDFVTGTGLSSAAVNIYDATGAFVMNTGTGPTGNYIAWSGLPPGTYFARTGNTTGHFNQLYQGQECDTCAPSTGTPIVVTAGTITTVDFALKPGGGVVSGLLVDAETGDALTDGGVSVYDEAGAFVASGFVDGTGQYVVTAGLATGTYYAATFNGQGYLNQVYDGLSCNPCSVASGTPIHLVAGTSVTIDFELFPGGRIGGTVTEAGGGEPLVNVVVDIYDSSGAFVTNARTDGSGSYTTGALPGGTYFAKTFNTLGYFNQVYSGRLCINCTVTTGTPIEVAVGMVTTGINFALSPGAQISGHIEDAATGLPVSNGGVNVYDSGGRYVTSGWTNGAGDYVIDGALVPGTYYAATFNGVGYINQLHEGFPCLSCDVTTGTPIQVVHGAKVTINFALTLGGQISGQVTDESTAAALSNVTVAIYTGSGSFAASASTDQTGAYVVSGLIAGSYYARTFNSSGYIDGLYAGLSCLPCTVTTGTPIVLTAGTTRSGVDFALALGARISGRVTDAASGNGYAGVQVQVFSPTGAFLTSAVTDGSGNYLTSGLLPGMYFARAARFNSLQVTVLYDAIPCVTCTVQGGTPIHLEAIQLATGVNFVLSAGGQVTGHVSDGASGAGLEGVFIQIFDGTGGAVAAAVTDASGDYAVTTALPAGTYFAAASGTEGYVGRIFGNSGCVTCPVTSGTPIAITPGIVTSGIDFGLIVGGRISGHITDASTGGPLNGITVLIFDENGSAVSSARADSSGLYLSGAGLVAGSYFVRTSNVAGYVNKLYPDIDCPGCTVTEGNPIVVTTASTTDAIDFTLTTGARIQGRVMSAATTLPIANVTVQIADERGVVVTTALTNVSGDYLSRDGLLPGTYFLRTRNGQLFVNGLYENLPCLNCSFDTGTPVTVDSDTLSGIDFTLTSGGRFAGRVTDASTGNGIRGATVHMYDAGGEEVGTSTTGGAGTFLSDPVPTGSYFGLVTSATGYVNQLYRNIPCVTCTVTTGDPIPVSASNVTPSIDFALSSADGIAAMATQPAKDPLLGNVLTRLYTPDGDDLPRDLIDVLGRIGSGPDVRPSTFFVSTIERQSSADHEHQNSRMTRRTSHSISLGLEESQSRFWTISARRQPVPQPTRSFGSSAETQAGSSSKPESQDRIRK